MLEETFICRSHISFFGVLPNLVTENSEVGIVCEYVTFYRFWGVSSVFSDLGKPSGQLGFTYSDVPGQQCSDMNLMGSSTLES